MRGFLPRRFVCSFGALVLAVVGARAAGAQTYCSFGDQYYDEEHKNYWLMLPHVRSDGWSGFLLRFSEWPLRLSKSQISESASASLGVTPIDVQFDNVTGSAEVGWGLNYYVVEADRDHPTRPGPDDSVLFQLVFDNSVLYYWRSTPSDKYDHGSAPRKRNPLGRALPTQGVDSQHSAFRDDRVFSMLQQRDAKVDVTMWRHAFEFTISAASFREALRRASNLSRQRLAEARAGRCRPDSAPGGSADIFGGDIMSK